MRWGGHICSFQGMFYLSATLSRRSISQPCAFCIFDKWAFRAQTSSSNWFKNKLLKVNFLILALVTAMKMDGAKQGLHFAEEELSFPAVLANGKFVCKEKQ